MALSACVFIMPVPVMHLISSTHYGDMLFSYFAFQKCLCLVLQVALQDYSHFLVPHLPGMLRVITGLWDPTSTWDVEINFINIK